MLTDLQEYKAKNERNIIFMKTGAQLYTVRSYIQNENDFACSMKKIAEMGYTTVQISAMGSSISPQTARDICDRNNLEIVLTHSDVNRILYDTDALIKEHDILGCNYIGIGCMPEKYRTKEWLNHFMKDFKEPAKKIAASGKLLMYHNHDLEFEAFEAEEILNASPKKKIFEYLMEGFSKEEMGFTLDTYWVAAAGADVCEWIRILKDRIPCVHLKDMQINYKAGGRIMAPVMEGNLNFKAILQELENTCCKYLLVEQDVCTQGTPFECLKTSYDNLAKAGYR